VTAEPTTMWALRYHLSVPRYLLAGALGKWAPIALAPLRHERVPRPVPPEGWRRVDVRLAGLCGTDLTLLFGTQSPRLSAFTSFPCVPGHEILGEVEGSRVVINPTIACLERGLDPCPACRRGDDNLCANIAEGTLAPGAILGLNSDLPGGWSETVMVREERLHAVPDGVPDEVAVLAEPVAVAWRAARVALESTPRRADAARLLVIGSGTIGLTSVIALRRAGYTGELHAVARYPAQAEAMRSIGVDHVHADAAGASRSVGGRSYRTRIGPPAWRGGFDAVIDAAGSRSSLDAGVCAAREGAAVILIGTPGLVWQDLSPLWSREVRLIGSYVYTAAEFAEAVGLLPEMSGLRHVTTRRYPLARHREAIVDLRARRTVKVAFDPRAA
jgi:threonine dehydrogenase-like Zn-dependent dehydrogenase